MEYLEFELPVKEMHEQLEKCKLIGSESNVDVSETCLQIEKKLEKVKKEDLQKHGDISFLLSLAESGNIF